MYPVSFFTEFGALMTEVAVKKCNTKSFVLFTVFICTYVAVSTQFEILTVFK
jgi:hypothetical protein